MIAVLIPTFKTGNYFENCLRSLENQTLGKDGFVVYIALNGPEFPYRKYIESLLASCELNHKFFYLKNPGVSDARNFLIDKSDEPFICFVDDDDFLSNNYLEFLLLASDEESIGVSNVRVFSDNPSSSRENYIGKSYVSLRTEESSLFRARKYFSSPCAKIISRVVIGSCRFDVNLSRGEDGLFMAQLSPRVKRIRKALPEACYYVRQRPDSASRKKIRKIEEIKRVGYLELCYMKMLFSSSYKKSFILTRVIATLFQLKKAFK